MHSFLRPFSALFVLRCGGPAPANAIPLAEASVTVETEREQVLRTFDRQCSRGTFSCDGLIAGTPEAHTPAPGGAAGFDFSLTLDDADKQCRAAGQLWLPVTRESFACSGSAGARLPFHVDLFGCRGHLCRLVLSELVGRDLGRFDAVDKELAGLYGPVYTREVAVPAACNETLAACIHDGRAKVRSMWRWDVGYTITASLEATSPSHLFLFVAYSTPSFAESLRTRGL